MSVLLFSVYGHEHFIEYTLIALFFLGHLEVCEFLEKLTSENSEKHKKIFQKFRKFGIIFF
jgi:hypothetical protein